jgi:transcriptional regulator with XRE-family HTH domain
MKPIHEQVVELRHLGQTQSEICSKTGLSKGTVSYILKKYFPADLQASMVANHSQEHSRSVRTKEHLEKLNQARMARYRIDRESARQRHLHLMKSYLDQNLIYYVAGLYAGEGAKDKNSFSISNSNPRILLCFLKFAREVLELPMSRLSVALYIHGSMDRDVCSKYWETTLGVPVSYIVQADNRAKSKATDKWEGRYYGTIRLLVRKPLGMQQALEEYYW